MQVPVEAVPVAESAEVPVCKKYKACSQRIKSLPSYKKLLLLPILIPTCIVYQIFRCICCVPCYKCKQEAKKKKIAIAQANNPITPCSFGAVHMLLQPSMQMADEPAIATTGYKK